MKNVPAGLASALVFVLFLSFTGSARAEGADVVTLKDGSAMYGEVIEMSNGELMIKMAFGVEDVVKIKWGTVAKLTTTHPLPFHLKEGTVLVAMAQEGESGTLLFQAQPMTGFLTVPLDAVVSINPLVQPPVVYSGSLQVGFLQTTGNSYLRNASMIGEFTGRSEKLRLTLLGRYIYGDDGGRWIVRNSRGTIKLDFFLTKRFSWFAASYFEQDTFQDLNLRTSLSGHGYQLIDKGDFSSGVLKDMTLYAEIGTAYFNEDFKIAQDKTSFRGRWSVKLNWPIHTSRRTPVSDSRSSTGS